MLPPPLPQECLDSDEDEHEFLLASFAMLLQILMSIPPPPIFQDISFPQSLLPQSRNSHEFFGRDVVSMFSIHEYLFWLVSGETPETFNELVDNVYAIVLSRQEEMEMQLLGQADLVN